VSKNMSETKELLNRAEKLYRECKQLRIESEKLEKRWKKFWKKHQQFLVKFETFKKRWKELDEQKRNRRM